MAEKTRINEQGLVEILDDEGNVKMVQSRKKGMKKFADRPKPKSAIHMKKWPFNLEKAHWVCELIEGGSTLKDIDAVARKYKDKPPRWVIMMWMRKYPEFEKMVKASRRIRAEAFHDELIDAARTSTPKKAKVDRLKIDALKWAAAVGDPESYGSKNTGDGGAPVQIIVQTGVPETLEKPVPNVELHSQEESVGKLTDSSPALGEDDEPSKDS